MRRPAHKGLRRRCSLWNLLHARFGARSNSPAEPKTLNADGSGESLTALPTMPAKTSTTFKGHHPASNANDTAEITPNDSPGSHDTIRELSTRTPNSLFAQQHILKRRSSAGLLQTVLRRKMSKDSNWSGTSKRDSLASVTEEEIERRREMKRAMSERLRGDFLGERPSSALGHNAETEAPGAESSRLPGIDGPTEDRPETDEVEGVEGIATPCGTHKSQSFPQDLRNCLQGERKVEGPSALSSKTWPVSERIAPPIYEVVEETQEGCPDETLERSHSSRTSCSLRKPPSANSGLSRMPSISEYVPPEWRRSLGSRQRSDLSRPTILQDRNGNVFAAAGDPTSRHQQTSSTAKTDKVNNHFKAAGQPGNTDLSEVMSQISIPEKENRRSVSDSPSFSQLHGASRPASISSYHTDVHRSRSGRSTINKSFETAHPITIHGLDGSKASDELKGYSTWVKGQQSSSMEVESSEANAPKMRGHRSQNFQTESLQSSVDEYHSQGPGAAERIVSRRKSRKEPRKSHFKEEFEPYHSKSKSSCEDQRGRHDSDESIASSTGLDGQGDRRPSQQHRGSMSQLVTQSDDEAANLWEKALQNHAWQMSIQNGQSSSRKRSVSPLINRPPPGRRMSALKSHSASDFRRHHRDHLSSIVNIGPNEIPVEQSASPVPQEERPSGVWARFPSHTRHERAESAGSADHVSTYDFGSLASSESLSPEALKKRDSKRHTKPQSYFQMLKTRYSNELTKDFRRLERGYRSSVSTGGVLEHPELELLPKMSPAYLMRPKAASAPTGQTADMSKARETVSSEYGDWNVDRSSSEGTAADGLMAPPPRSAKAWSKIYNECVDGASEQESGEEGRALKTSKESSRPSDDRRRLSVARNLRPTSSESAMDDVRKSTMDFQRTLRLQEAESLSRVLQAVERIGEDMPLPAHAPGSVLRECSVA